MLQDVLADFCSLEDFHRLLVELPEWATGLPIAPKVSIRPRYAKATAPLSDKPAAVSAQVAEVIAAASPEFDDDEDSDLFDALDNVPLADLVTEPLTNRQICCPFHEDRTPSLRIYDNGYYCFSCGAHG